MSLSLLLAKYCRFTTPHHTHTRTHTHTHIHTHTRAHTAHTRLTHGSHTTSTARYPDICAGQTPDNQAPFTWSVYPEFQFPGQHSAIQHLGFASWVPLLNRPESKRTQCTDNESCERFLFDRVRTRCSDFRQLYAHRAPVPVTI